jgi:hypothetical protein
MAGKRRPEGRASRNLAMRSGISAANPQATAMTPSLKHVYAASESGKITHEEAKDLNPSYDPQKKYGVHGSNTQKNQYRQFQNAAAGFMPNQSDTALAYKMGHITKEEAESLNPTFDPNKNRVDVNRSNISKNPVPSPQKVAVAQRHGHITSEEADDLNPAWIRNTGRARAHTNVAKKGGKTPSLQDVHKAIESKNITIKEGESLNPKYDSSNSSQQVSLRKYIKRNAIKSSGEGKTPAMIDVHQATASGHISTEEAANLNSKYSALTEKQTKYLDSNLQKRTSGYQKQWSSKSWNNKKMSRQFNEVTT